jgi:hypothetical protein
LQCEDDVCVHLYEQRCKCDGYLRYFSVDNDDGMCSLSLSSLEGDDDDDGPGGEGDMAAGAPSDGTRTPPASSSKAHKVRRSSRHRNDSLTSVGELQPNELLYSDTIVYCMYQY